MFRRRSTLLSRFAHSQAGVAAVEFAFIAPLMITTYIGSSELCNVLLLDRKVTNVSAAATDLVAQSTNMTDGEITDIFSAASAIMEPYSLTSLQVIVTSVIGDQNGDPVVAWSDAYQATPHAAGASMTLPDGVLLTGGSVVVTEVRYTYNSPFSSFLSSGITLTDEFYQRPRRVMQIPRT